MGFRVTWNMKTFFRWFSISVLAYASTTFSRAATTPAPSPVPGPLQVQVNVPPSWRPMFEERVSDSFVAQVDESFQRSGFKGKIQQVESIDTPAAGSSLLTINLTEWRVDPIGNIDCTFTANLKTGTTTKSLGIFTYSAFRWMSGPGRFGLSDAFEDAAQGALRDLYRAIAKTQLVPGIRTR